MTPERRASKREADQRRREAEPWRAWYGTQRWRRRARMQLMLEPLCRMCADRGDVRAATVADHVVPHRGNAVLFWHGDLQSLCTNDHNQVKQREEARGYADSVDVDGWPADPRHPANAHQRSPHAHDGPSAGPTPGGKSLGPLASRPAATRHANSREIGNFGDAGEGTEDR